MLRRAPFLLSFALLATLIACGAEGPTPGPDELTSWADPEAIRTADPFARGLDPGDFPRVKALAEGVYSYEQLRSAGEEWFTTVSMFVITSEGVLVADGQGNVEETQRLVDTIAEMTDQPITHVVIASDHGDHTAGNVAFPGDAAFIAHPTSAQVLRAAASRWDPASNAPPVILPTELVQDEATLELGGREIQILFKGRAHTGGDLVVYLPEERILFMSEAYLHRVFPAMRSAFPSEWVEMIERVQDMDVDIYVPGHGFVDSPEILREELEIYRQAMVQVIETVTDLHAAGLSLEEAQAQADFGGLEEWSLSSSQGPIAVAQVYRELNGELPPE
jgi:cyclase